jgi:hypothetical protein
MAVTSSDRYALGRNSTVTLGFRSKTLVGGVYSYSGTYDTFFEICISEGSVSLDTDNIDIPSNCQSGWRIKLPGLKSGTVSGTGYIAVTTGASLPLTSAHKYNIYKYLGDPCQVYITGEVPEISNAEPFVLEPFDSTTGNGYFKTGSVTINPDDALKISFAIELSGAQDVLGFVAAGGLA